MRNLTKAGLFGPSLGSKPRISRNPSAGSSGD